MQEQGVLIEQFIRGELSSQQQTEFLSTVQQSPKLAAELALQQDIFRELGDEKKRNFASQLHAIEGDFFKQQPDVPPAPGAALGRWWILPVLLVLGGAIWYFWPQKPETAATAPTNPTNPTTSTNPTADSPSSETLKVAPNPTSSTNSTTSTTPTNSTTPITPTTSTTDKGPSFVPNAYWENLIGKNLTGSADKIITASGRIKKGNQAALSLQFKWPKGEQPAPMTVYFYNNSEQDRLNNNSLKQVNFDLLQQMSEGADAQNMTTYSMDYSADVNWAPGVYYFIVAERGSAKPMFVGRLK
jgi:hypothetical protein